MRVILFGYYGFRNIGDEKCLDETVRLLQAFPGGVSYKVARGAFQLPFPSFNRWNIWSWLAELCQSNVMIMGGGSVFQSQTGLLSLIYYLFIVVLARLCGCQVILLCHGWGPFRLAWHESLAKCILRLTKRSWRMLEPPFLGDKSFCDLTLLESSKLIHMSNDHNVIGLAFRSDFLRDSCETFFKSQGVSVIRLDNQYPYANDAIPLEDVWDSHDLPLEQVMTDRFHTAIWASKQGLPYVSISEDPKLIDLAIQTGQVNVLSVDEWLQQYGSLPQLDQTVLQAWLDAQSDQKDSVKKWLYDSLAH